MRYLSVWMVLALLFATGAPGGAGARPLQPLEPPPAATTGSLADETPAAWFVELSAPPAADGTRPQALLREQAAFRAAAARAGVRYDERFAYTQLWHGLSVRASPDQAARLVRLPGVRAIYPVITVELPRPDDRPGPDLSTALAMTGADRAQTELGYTGAGVRVAVMDTGVDYHHPDLGGCFGPGCRVAFGHDFVGDAFNANPDSPDFSPAPAPDPDPDDCNGHGTHVAGIIGAGGDPAAGGVRGVAPEVTFGAYRVFGCDGSTTADIMLAAMEQALADGMDVLNMSIGSAFQWPRYPTAEAADRLVNRGVVVVASIGNSGQSGVFSAGAPGVGRRVIGVASFDNSHVSLRTFTASPDGADIGFAPATAAPAPPIAGSFPLARTGTATAAADACSPLAPGSLAGQVALIRRGGCTFHTKALNAQNAGAAAVVLYNNVPGQFNATVAGTPPIAVPVVTISDAEGALLDSRLAAGPVTLTWTDRNGIFPNPTGGLISAFSSYGPSPDLDLKPDLGAPGGLIRSTYPLELGGYATISGTSMSSPHVAGAAALLRQARPELRARDFRTVLQNSADPAPWWGNPGLGFLDNVHRQGAGMLDVDDAILAAVMIEPGKLTLGESQAGPARRRLTVHNRGLLPVTLALSHAPSLSTGGSTFAPSFFTGFAAVEFSADRLAVPPGGVATVDVTITANPDLPDGSLYGGYIVLAPAGGGPVYRVPYAGFKGDYQALQVLAPTPFGLPLLARVQDGGFAPEAAGAAFTMAEGDIPYFLVHFAHQSRRVRFEVRDAATGRNHGRFLELDHFGRDASSTGFFAFGWDGTIARGDRVEDVPDGEYVVVITVEKALAEEGNPDHVEVWTSPAFVVDRP